MAVLRLFCFGSPRIERDGQTLPLRRTKALSLLVYLAVTGQPQDRNTILALLWPEFDEASARNNLRRELSLLKTLLGDDVLLADRMQLRMNSDAGLWVDVAEFQAHLAAVSQHKHDLGELCHTCHDALVAAADVQRDDFMAGFTLPESPAFDDWQFFQREGLRQQLATLLQTLIDWYQQSGDYLAASEYARRWLALDPLHEPAQRALMRLYAWSGKKSAALRVYDESVRVLENELGVAPEAETVALYEEIKARQLTPPPAAESHAPRAESRAVEPPAPPAPRQAVFNLPRTTDFVGRERELTDIIRRLTDPACRLLTLTGPGGIGKTRLALQAAHVMADVWAGDETIADGVLFVPLEAARTINEFVSALAGAARIDFFPGIAPQQQVLDALRDRRMLIVLDNFEQLLDAADFVGDILAAAPGVRVLVTSRVALNLRDEWFHPIDGLSFPATEEEISGIAQLARFDAVRLFEQRARQVRGDFSLSRAREQVVRLCQLVAGMPLALELAGAWLKILPVDQVVEALERSLDILTTRDRDTLARHSSMRAVLEESWRMLSVEEQQAFARLAVFSGGFSAGAAQTVVGASLFTLATLVEKSLIRSGLDGRYQMHELLRQYGAERLARDPAHVAEAQQAHSAYYIDFLAARRAAISGTDQAGAVAEILAEQDNIRVAWQWAATQGDLTAIERAGHTVAVFYEFRGRYREGVAVLEQAVEPLRALPAERRRDLVYAARLVDLGWMYIRLGDLASARTALEESRVLFATHNTIPLPEQASDPLLGLGMVALLAGQYAEAARLGEVVLERSGDAQHAASRPRALFLLTKAVHAQGQYAQARRYAEEALAVAAKHGHRWLVASLYNELGTTLCAMGEYAEAAHHYQTYYTLRAAFDDRRGMATALHGLGRVALHQQRYAEARDLFERSLGIIRQVGAWVDTGFALEGLAAVAYATGNYEGARRHLAEALQLALDSASLPLLLTVVTSAAQLLLLSDKVAWGPEALELVLRHQASDREINERASRLLAQYERQLAPDQFAAAVQRGRQGGLQLFTPQLQAILSVPLQIEVVASA